MPDFDICICKLHFSLHAIIVSWAKNFHLFEPVQGQSFVGRSFSAFRQKKVRLVTFEHQSRTTTETPSDFFRPYFVQDVDLRSGVNAIKLFQGEIMKI